MNIFRGKLFFLDTRTSQSSGRNQAVGLCALMAKIGGITTMLLDLLKLYWLPAPVFTMGIFTTLAGLLALNFPETTGSR